MLIDYFSQNIVIIGLCLIFLIAPILGLFSFFTSLKEFGGTAKNNQKLFATRELVSLENFSMVSSASHAQNFKKTKMTIYQKFILLIFGSLF